MGSNDMEGAMARIRMDESWKRELMHEFTEPYFRELTARVRTEYSTPGMSVIRRRARFSLHSTTVLSTR